MDQMDKTEATLALLEKEEKAFRGHWVWKDLHCTPEQFFSAVNTHVQSLNIPPEKWNTAYNKAKQASKVRSAERRGAYRPMNLQMMGALRV